MASSLTSIASSGLKAAQMLLNTTSNNITNVYTDGYSRQTVTLSSTTTSSGVTISSVNRAYEELTVAQLRNASASYAATSSYYDQISQIDSLLSSDDSSIDTLLSNFFSSLSSLSANASDSSARQAVLSSAESLVTQLQTIDDYLTSMDSAINQQITTSIDQVNSYAEQIAELNEQIAKLGSDSSSANALLDQRDQLINKLNDIIGVTVSTQDDSVVTVSLSNGMTLVQGSTAYSLTTVTDSTDTSRLTIAYDNGSGNLTNINESEISGGSIAGLFAVRDDIDSTRNTLGQIALTLASNLNELQSEGYDLSGDAGTDFFTYDDPSVSAYTTNSGSASLTAAYSDTSAVAASDYTLAYKDGNWTVTKVSDGSTIDYTTSTDGDGNTALTFDGLTVTVSGAADSGDSFTVESVSGVISSLSVALSDGSLIAAAGTTDGDSDNSNLTKMQALQTSDLINGTYTLTESYAALIGNIGVKTSSADSLSTSQSTIVTTLTEQQQSVSGVNLDEEYVNLTAYQQYYSACAQVLSTANNIFDSLLSAIN
ncbi:flagellar hook-associated protein FlgK [Brenneria tiliae]|uniref:flagellar hook-associated protein FlgK n=1 Tax=Brenneria tiliae TaxID=2914984 RepID=UPI002014FAD4|nr:flagellar hook-associated protein FlgK [Brenneria tiliae]MCL2899825.1 flagellar hook-associated protein FlgK [Brenneria tiliae]MCL2904686.1 flagellar hook-associated protein FlgK [Brenneria tiliae]